MQNTDLTKFAIQQLDPLIKAFNDLHARSKYDDLSDVADTATVLDLLTRSRAAITRISGPRSPYSSQCQEIIARQKTSDLNKLPAVIGVVRSLHSDVSSGFLKSFEERIHGDLFSDFLEMARHLQENGYKDAAAVIAGSSLEAHLKQLCVKNQISTSVANSKGELHPKKADVLNSDLVAADVYSKLDQKNVTAWLALRNNAAHGNYAEYTREQVTLLIDGISNFITRNPA